MKKMIFLILCLCGSAGFTQNAVEAAGKLMAQQPEQAAAKQAGDLLLINPQARADDWVQAYHFLQKQQAAANIVFKLHNGQLLKNILSIKIMPGGTVMAFELNTTAGIRYEIVKVEDVDEIIQE